MVTHCIWVAIERTGGRRHESEQGFGLNNRVVVCHFTEMGRLKEEQFGG